MLARAAIPSHMMHDFAGFRRGLTVCLSAALAAGSVGACAGKATQKPRASPDQDATPARIAVGEPHPATPSTTPSTTPTSTPAPRQDGQASTSDPAPKAGVDLSPRLTAGLLARYSVHVEGQEANELTGSMAARSETKWDATLDVLVRVEPKADMPGQWTATVSLDRIRATDVLDGRPIAYDSAEPVEKDPANLVRPSIQGLVGQRFELDLDAHGTVTEARIPADLARRHNPSTRWTTRLMGDADLRALFGPIFSTGIARDAGANADRAAIGDSWQTTRQEPFGSAGVTTTVTHTLESADSGVATIALNGDAAITPNERVPAGIQRISRGAFSGTTRWDLSRGLLASYEMGRETQVQVRPDPDGFSILKTQLVQVRRVD